MSVNPHALWCGLRAGENRLDIRHVGLGDAGIAERFEGGKDDVLQRQSPIFLPRFPR
jgi:hypothetical protein